MPSGLSVVIPNYNGRSLFPHTLPTLFEALQQCGRPFEVIVVDDASTDDSLSYLQTHFPQIRQLQNPMNRGFSVTVNKGVAAAVYPLVLLLNSDVKLTPDYFNPLFRFFEDPTTFGVMGRIIGWEDTIVQDGAKYPFFHGAKIKTSGDYLLANEKQMDQGLYSFYLSGANALVRKDYYQSIGGMNEAFSPFYIEDFELSLRAWRLGYTCYYEHNAICRHRTSSTVKAKDKKRFVEIIYHRNKMLLHAIHLDGLPRIFYFLQLGGELLLKAITGRWSYLQSFQQFLQKGPAIRQSRLRLHQLQSEQGLLSVRQVATRIRNTLQGKTIIRF